MARLNSECSDAALQQNCVVGQKWRCVNEGGRWRKHKCKFHVSIAVRIPSITPPLFRNEEILENNTSLFSNLHHNHRHHQPLCVLNMPPTQLQLQHHLAEINKISSQNKRNCACFTPDGVVYTKIKTEKNGHHSHLHKRQVQFSILYKFMYIMR